MTRLQIAGFSLVTEKVSIVFTKKDKIKKFIANLIYNVLQIIIGMKLD